MKDFTLRSIASWIFLVLLVLHTGCAALKLDSQWREGDIVIDGKNDDWLGKMYMFEEENISVGFLNDDQNMYVCLIAEESRMRMQIMSQGLILWFDRTGGKNKTFGVKFPVGMEGMRAQGGFRDMRGDEQDQERMGRAFAEALTDLEIIGPQKEEWRRMPVKDATGIEVQLKASSGMLVYEIKVPLLRTEQNLYAVGAKPGDLIGIGLEVPKMDLGAFRGGRGGGPGGGMPGGGRGGMGGIGGRSSGMPGRVSQMPKGLKIWASVTLASTGSSTQGEDWEEMTIEVQPIFSAFIMEIDYSQREEERTKWKM